MTTAQQLAATTAAILTAKTRPELEALMRQILSVPVTG